MSSMRVPCCVPCLHGPTRTGRIAASMRAVLALLLIVLGLPLSGAPTRPAGPERLVIGGREYARLADWAGQRGLSLRRTVRNECQVTGSNIRMALTLDSQRISLNGVHIWLSAPVAVARGEPWVTVLDLVRSIEPVLNPRRARGRVRTICLDAGHGGHDTGNREGRRQEKDYTLALARELSAQLTKAGYRVLLTRNRDTYLDLGERSGLANHAKADVFLSLHFNAGGNGGDARGPEVYCLTPVGASSTNARGEGAHAGAFAGNVNNSQNMALAYHLQRALVQRPGVEDRGVKRARFAVLRTAEMPAALIEGAFMSNPTEMSRINDATWRRQLAEAIVRGVRSYCGAIQ